MEKVVIVIDNNWDYTSGVVTATAYIKQGLERRGFEVRVIHAGEFVTLPLPTYPEFRLALTTRRHLTKILQQQRPQYIHIVTEGPLGLAARLSCVKNNWRFTTAYHTNLPDYANLRLRGLKNITYSYLRWFHRPSSHIMVSTPALEQKLQQHGFFNLAVVPLGVDIELFKKNPAAELLPDLRRPVFVYFGRIAVEKNLPAFLELKLPGSKLIIGDGPERLTLQRRYPHTKFVGFKKGQDLVDLLSAADVFVTPSTTETFGLTSIEALACGLPVAAFDSQGLRDVINSGRDGYLGSDLATNAIKCLSLDREQCRATALRYSWDAATDEFIKNLVPVRP